MAPLATPELHKETLFQLDANGRIAGTREPGSARGPLFWLARGRDGCAWAVRCDVPDEIAGKLASLAADEPPATDLRAPPRHADRYRALVEGEVDAGPAFHFPARRLPKSLPESGGIVFTKDLSPLARHFPDWRADEIDGRLPIATVRHEGHAVSVCCCARRSDHAAEAGVETAEAFRGRGLAARVTTAWALAVRSSGRTPLYSTSWSNAASLAVARKLGLRLYAGSWSVRDAISRNPA